MQQQKQQGLIKNCSQLIGAIYLNLIDQFLHISKNVSTVIVLLQINCLEHAGHVSKSTKYLIMLKANQNTCGLRYTNSKVWKVYFKI